MNNIAIIGIALYTLIGLALIIIGPFGRDLRRDVERMRGKSLLGLIHAEEGKSIPSAPTTRVVVFVIIMSVVFIVFWPIFLVSEFKSKDFGLMGGILKRQDSSLTFSAIGGAGRIVCGDCDHTAKIVSFLHGTDNCTTGYQCQSCGQFAQVNDSLSDTIEKGCQCGGTLSRQEKLFCPKCRSKSVRYLMEYIT